MDDAQAKIRHAKAVHSRGELDEAESLYRRLLGAFPENAEILSCMGMLQFQKHRKIKAIEYFTKALAITPENPEIHSNIGKVFLSANRNAEAIRALTNAVRLDPKSADNWYNLGLVQYRSGLARAAEIAFRRAIQALPGHEKAASQLAKLLISELRYRDAAEMLRKVIANAPAEPDPKIALANALEHMHQYGEAEQAIDEALTLGGGRVKPDMIFIKARLLRRKGSYAAAMRLFEHALREFPEQNIPQGFWYEYGNLLNETADYDGAFHAFATANARFKASIPRNEWKPEAYQNLIRRKYEWVAEQPVETWPRFPQHMEKPPIFFVGFPRSGTTLLEEILASHPAIVTTRELSPVAYLRRDLSERLGRDFRNPEDIPNLREGDIAFARQSFFKHARNTVGSDLKGKHLVDKLPLNIINVELINCLFPESKIIVAIRDPRDTVLSCYMRGFSSNPAMQNFIDCRSTAETYALVMNLWLLHRSKLNLDHLEYRYEDLIDDFAETVAAIMRFLQIPWDDRIHRFAESAAQRDVRTPSYDMVVKPITRAAVGRWRKYEQHLAPVLPLLAPFIREWGYEID